MRPRPAVVASLVAMVALGAWPIGHMWWSALPRAEREAAAIEAQPEALAKAQAETLARALGDELVALAAREAERPWFHWQHWIADPRGVYDGEALVPSPLAAKPTEPLVFAYLQIDERGRVTTPEVFEGEEPSSPDALARHAEVVAGVSNLVGGGAVAANTPVESGPGGRGRPGKESGGEDDVQQVQQVQQAAPPKEPVKVRAGAAKQSSKIKYLGNQDNEAQAVVEQRLDNAFYQQNMNVGEVYQQIKGKRARAAPAVGQVSLRLSGFTWSEVSLGEPALVALRVVETPDGTLRQGFAVKRSALVGALTAMASEARLEFAAPEGLAGVAGMAATSEVGLGGREPGPQLTVEVPVESSVAEARAASLVSEARMTALLTTLAVLMVLGLIMFVTLQSERLLVRRQRFAAAAAHELRTPLAGLRMYAEMLAHGLGRPEKQRLYAERLVTETARLGRVVSNVLEFTRLEKGGLGLTPQPGDLAAKLREVAHILEPTLAGLGAELTLVVPETLPARFDPDALTQILYNLVDNAEKYSRESVDRTLTLSAERTPRGVEVRLRDRGPGLPRRRKGLFSPFARGVGADGPAGLGLGLSLSRALARAQGGDLVAADVDGPGAELVFTLPADPGGASRSRDEAAL